MQLLPVDSEIVALLMGSPAPLPQGDPWGLRHVMHARRTVCGEISLPIRADFIGLCGNAEELRRETIVCVRDGALPLFLFFRRCPEPAGFAGKLLVPARLAALVPEAWEARTLLFRYRSAGRPPAKASRLVLCGLADEEGCSLEFLESSLNAVRARADQGLREVSCFLPYTKRTWSPDLTYLPELVRMIRRKFAGTKISLLDSDDFDELAADGDTVFHELNQEGICSVSRLTWALLSRGIRSITGLVHDRKEAAPLRIIPVSPWHGLEVYSPRALAGPTRAELAEELWALAARSHLLGLLLERGTG